MKVFAIMKTILTTFTLILAATWSLHAEPLKALKVGEAAPAFKIKDTRGKEIDLSKLSDKGPVLV